jgi:integrase
MPEAVRPVVRFAFLIGWRCASEVLPLQWRNVDFKAREVRLDPGASKTGEPRVFPFTSELRELLDARWREHEQLQEAGVLCPWVFCRVERTRTGATKAERIHSFTGAWRTACRKAGVPGRFVHDLRRSFVRNAVRAGIPDAVVQRLSGHKTRSILERYNITSDGDLRGAAARLDEHAQTTPAATAQRSQ